MPKAQVFFVSQWFNGRYSRNDDLQHPIGIVFAVDEDQAKAAVPAIHIASDVSSSGSRYPVAPTFDDLGEVEVAGDLPIFLEI